MGMEMHPPGWDDLIEARIRELNDAMDVLRELATRDFKSLSIYEILSMRYLVIQLVQAAAAICIYIMGELGERPGLLCQDGGQGPTAPGACQSVGEGR